MIYFGNIIIYSRQVVVHYKNALLNEATTLHFHGIHQRQTPWMDGAGHISHCPITPGQTFTYRYIINSPSHSGAVVSLTVQSPRPSPTVQ